MGSFFTLEVVDSDVKDDRCDEIKIMNFAGGCHSMLGSSAARHEVKYCMQSREKIRAQKKQLAGANSTGNNAQQISHSNHSGTLHSIN